MSFVSVMCCRAEISAKGRSFIQKSPTECGEPEFDLETSTKGALAPLGYGIENQTVVVLFLTVAKEGFFFKTSTLSPKPVKFPVQRVLGTLPRRVQRPECQGYRPSPKSTPLSNRRSWPAQGRRYLYICVCLSSAVINSTYLLTYSMEQSPS